VVDTRPLVTAMRASDHDTDYTRTEGYFAVGRRGEALVVEYGDDCVLTVGVDDGHEAADVLNGLLARLRRDAGLRRRTGSDSP
jgi:hypothetical protein